MSGKPHHLLFPNKSASVFCVVILIMIYSFAKMIETLS